MKKLTLNSFLTSIIILIVTATNSQTTSLKPLYEEFTSSTCAPCVYANEVIMEVLSANPDEYTLIKYQMNWPGAGDPYYTSEGGVRKNYYGVNFVPDLYINGEQLDPASSLTQTIFDQYANALTALEIEITQASIDSDNIITIAADLTPLDNYAAGLTAHVVVIEKLTVFNIGTNGETEWHNVMMKMLPDASGTTLGALTTGVPVSLNETFDMDNTFMETPNDLAVVVFVQDEIDKSIVQSAVLDVDGTFVDFNVTYTVEDENGIPVEGAKIEMENYGSKFTDATGQAVYEGVYPGTYAYDVLASGYFPNSGSITVTDQNVFETVVMETPAYYWHEMFDDDIPTDWTVYQTNPDYLYWWNGLVIFFNQSTSTDHIMLVSPSINIDPADKIYFDVGEAAGDPTLVFGTVTDPSDPETFEEFETYYPDTAWETIEFDLSGITDVETDVYFAWKLTTFANPSYFSFDNVILTEDTTGIDEVSINDILIYPIPTNDIVNIKTNKSIENYTIYDIYGSIRKQGVIDNNQIEISTLNSGIYLLRMGDVTAKIVKL